MAKSSQSFRTVTPLLEENADPELAYHPSPAQAFASKDDILHEDQSPAYKALQEAGLIVYSYRVDSSQSLDLVRGNASVSSNFVRRSLAYTAGVLVGGVVYDALFFQFTVQEGHVRPGADSGGSFFFYGPGVHRISRIFVQADKDISLQTARIEHGNRAIVTVPQGYVGLAFDRGQPILLPPGMHQWKSDTLKMGELIDMSSDVIRIGPFTLVTVDEGYAAITQDNGKQRILSGGATHMLTHRNWKFEKLISLKIHTDELGPFRATTADNVVLETVATVNWRVEDAATAARMAADTMGAGSNGCNPQEKQGISVNDSALQRDAMKQAVASLAAAIGSIRYADDRHVSASEKVTIGDSLLDSEPVAPQAKAISSSQDQDACGLSQIFSIQQMPGAAKHANEICRQYGVSIISINVISAFPVCKTLGEALGAGAVAAASAQQAEVAARGNAKARLIQAQADAEAARINAQAVADAEVMQAHGRKEAAALLESSSVAVDLARLEKTGQVLGERTSFFFGSTPGQVPAMLSNPKFVGDMA